MKWPSETSKFAIFYIYKITKVAFHFFINLLFLKRELPTYFIFPCNFIVMPDEMLDSNSPSKWQFLLPIFLKDLPQLSNFAIVINNYFQLNEMYKNWQTF